MESLARRRRLTALRLKTLAAEARSDRSVHALLAANVLAIVIALATRMSLREVMLVYWIQSVIIGLSFFVRIMSLERFTTEGLTMNGRPVETTASGKRRAALFFALHYGLFHVVYALFLLFRPSDAEPGPPASALGFWLCAAAFAVGHGYSLLENIAGDRAGQPNLGMLMMLPYARVVPMHLTIVFGGLLFQGSVALVIFCILKTVADLVMHTVEHHVLRTSRAAAGSQHSVSSTTS